MMKSCSVPTASRSRRSTGLTRCFARKNSSAASLRSSTSRSAGVTRSCRLSLRGYRKSIPAPWYASTVTAQYDWRTWQHAKCLVTTSSAVPGRTVCQDSKLAIGTTFSTPKTRCASSVKSTSDTTCSPIAAISKAMSCSFSAQISRRRRGPRRIYASIRKSCRRAPILCC